MFLRVKGAGNDCKVACPFVDWTVLRTIWPTYTGGKHNEKYHPKFSGLKLSLEQYMMRQKRKTECNSWIALPFTVQTDIDSQPY